jgi:hypothetical protein
MTTTPEYVRVYQSVVDDPKFVGVYDDDHHFATWVRFLMAADALWPASCPIPASARKASIAALVAAGIIDVQGTRFRVHGLDAERERRQTRARASASARYSDGDATAMRPQSERTANAERPQSVRDASTRAGASARLGSSLPEEDRARDANDPWDDAEGEAVTWLARHGCDIPPHSGYYRHLVTMVEAHGINAVVGMFDRLADAGMKNGDVKGYVFGARDALDSKTRPSLVDIAKAERGEDARAATKRAVENTRRYIAELKGADA